MAEQWGIITSGERYSADTIELDYGDGLGYRQIHYNPIWIDGSNITSFKGRIKCTADNNTLAIYVNGQLCNEQAGNNGIFRVDTSNNAEILFEAPENSPFYSLCGTNGSTFLLRLETAAGTADTVSDTASLMKLENELILLKQRVFNLENA